MYPVITIICGLPKSGKTSYRKQHFADTVPVVDETQFKADTSKTPYEQHKEVIDMVIERTVQELSTTGKDVIVEGCFVNPTDRRALIRRLKYYATLRCIYIKTPARLCMYRNNRIQNCIYNSLQERQRNCLTGNNFFVRIQIGLNGPQNNLTCFKRC